jgi:hypothetical protein
MSARLLGALAVLLRVPVVGATFLRPSCLAVLARGLPLLMRRLAALIRALVLAHGNVSFG